MAINIKTLPDSDLPVAIDSEQGLLSCVLQDPVETMAKAHWIEKPDFFREDHQWIWGICHQQGDKLTFATVAEALKAEERLDQVGTVGGRMGVDYLQDLFVLAGLPTAAETFALQLRTKRILRERIRQAEEDIRQALMYSSPDPMQFVERLEESAAKARKLALVGKGPVTFEQAREDLQRELEDRYEHGSSALKTPLPDLNKVLKGGFTKGFYTIAAAASAGKSETMLTFANYWALNLNQKIYWWSGETQPEGLVGRLSQFNFDTSSIVHTNPQAYFQNRAEYEHYMQRLRALDMPIVFDTTPATPLYLMSTAKALRSDWGGLDVMVVENIDLLTMPGRYESDTTRVRAAFRALKLLQMDLDIIVVALHQETKESSKKNQKTMQSLMGAGHQDSDAILIVNPDDYQQPVRTNTGDIVVVKNRLTGGTGPSPYYRNPKSGLISSLHNPTP